MKNYYKHLSRVQNHQNNVQSDIMTITSLMNNREKLLHLGKYAEQANDIDAINYCFSLEAIEAAI